MSRRTRLQMVLRLAAPLAVAWIGAHALIGHQATLAVSFTQGNVDISASRSSTVFSASNMAPGDVRHEELKISNDGSLEFSYTLTTHARPGNRRDRLL